MIVIIKTLGSGYKYSSFDYCELGDHNITLQKKILYDLEYSNIFFKVDFAPPIGYKEPEAQRTHEHQEEKMEVSRFSANQQPGL